MMRRPSLGDIWVILRSLESTVVALGELEYLFGRHVVATRSNPRIRNELVFESVDVF